MLYDMGDGNTTTADQVTYDEETGSFHAVDDTPFASEQEAIDHNRAILGDGTPTIDRAVGVSDPAGSDSYNDNPIDFSSIRPGLAGTGGYQNDNSDLVGTGAVDPHLAVTAGGSGIEDFFAGLATTTMNTAGQVIGTRLNAEVQQAQIKANQQLQRVAGGTGATPKNPAPSSSNGAMIGILAVAALIGGLALTSKRSR